MGPAFFCAEVPADKALTRLASLATLSRKESVQLSRPGKGVVAEPYGWRSASRRESSRPWST